MTTNKYRVNQYVKFYCPFAEQYLDAIILEIRGNEYICTTDNAKSRIIGLRFHDLELANNPDYDEPDPDNYDAIFAELEKNGAWD